MATDASTALNAAAPPKGPDPDGPDDRNLRGASKAAYQLAVYAAENGMPVPSATYAAIAHFKARISAPEEPTPEEEAAFLKAYEDLGHVTHPVSAKSLRDTDDSFARPNALGQKRSEARKFATRLAVRTGLILALVGAGEFTQSLVRGTLLKQEEAARLMGEKRKLWVQMAALNRRADAAPAETTQTKSFVLTDALLKERDDLERQLESNAQAEMEARTAADEGNAILSTVLRIDPVRLRYLLPTVAATLGGFMLPLLYGALGACAFLLRRVVQTLHDRSFMRKRSSDYGVRFYLGTLSGVAVQWVFVGNGKEIPGGFTPAVLAFAGGYSVDMIFAVFDRVIRTVTETTRTPDTSSPALAAGAAGGSAGARDDTPAPTRANGDRRGPDRPFSTDRAPDSSSLPSPADGKPVLTGPSAASMTRDSPNGGANPDKAAR